MRCPSSVNHASVETVVTAVRRLTSNDGVAERTSRLNAEAAKDAKTKEFFSAAFAAFAFHGGVS